MKISKEGQLAFLADFHIPFTIIQAEKHAGRTDVFAL